MHKRLCKICNSHKNHIDFEYVVRDKNFNNHQCFHNVKIIKNTMYYRCTFKYIAFIGIEFNTVVFQRCIFENCIFRNTKSEYLSFIQFDECLIKETKFISCSFFTLYIKDSDLVHIDFMNTYMKGSNLIGNSYKEVKFIDDCNLMDSVISETHDFMDIRFINEKSYTKLNYGSYIGEIRRKVKKSCDGKCGNMENSLYCTFKEDQLKISSSYMDFAEQYMINHVGGKYGVCFYESKKAFHETLKGRRKIKSYFSKIVCGYGEKPYRSFLMSVFIILAFSLLYMVSGIKTPRGILGMKSLRSDFTIYNMIETIIYSIYFSTVTFSTVGYGDLIPYGVIGAIFSVVEIILGILMVGIWTATLVRKMTR